MAHLRGPLGPEGEGLRQRPPTGRWTSCSGTSRHLDVRRARSKPAAPQRLLPRSAGHRHLLRDGRDPVPPGNWTSSSEAKSTLAAAGIIAWLHPADRRPPEADEVAASRRALRQERAVGQLYGPPAGLYGRHWRPMVLVGLTSIPILAAVYGIGGRRADRRDGRRSVLPRRRKPARLRRRRGDGGRHLRDLGLGKNKLRERVPGHAPALPEGRPRVDPQLHPRAP